MIIRTKKSTHAHTYTPLKKKFSKQKHTQTKMSKASPVVLSVADWDPVKVKYMAPKVNDRGGKSINLISSQSNRGIHLTTPLMMTWGISDFTDEKTGEKDGKYSMSLTFPNEEYATPATRDFLEKMKKFENQILDDAVKNSESWWGEEMSRELCKHTFFPFLKYSKNKETKKVDYTKPPSIRVKVPCYDDGTRWGVEIYDTKSTQIFPSDNPNHTPADFVPSMSSVACIIQCGGIWIGGKGWGLTWKLIQCIVKPREVVSVYGKCHIQLSPEDQSTIENQKIDDVAPIVDESVAPVTTANNKRSLAQTNDSDDEAETEPPKKAVATTPAPAPAPVVAPTPAVEAPVVAATVGTNDEAASAPAVKKTIVKKVVKKAA